MTTDTTITVTAEDIALGIAGDYYRCAVALALRRAFPDDEPDLHESDWQMRIQVWGRSVAAPARVTKFVRSFDSLERDDSGRVIEQNLPPEIAPFSFRLPPIDSPEWNERCYSCEGLFSFIDLDGEQYCSECAVKV